MPTILHPRRGDFLLNRESYFYRRGLRFAQLGLHYGGTAAFDSGPLRARGAFNAGMGGSGAWYYDVNIGMPYLFFTTGNAQVNYGTVSPVLGTSAFSISAWVFPLSSGLWDGPIVAWGDTGTAHDYIELNIDSSGFVHADQAGGSNSATFIGAATTDTWNHLLFVHRANSPLNGDSLWVNGELASGGGNGTATLDIEPGPLVMGVSEIGTAFNIYGAVGDVMIFDQKLGAYDAELLARGGVTGYDPGLHGLVMQQAIANAYDLENAR